MASMFAPPSFSEEFGISFEFFPGRGEKSFNKMMEAAYGLHFCEPRYMTVTYGADGSTRDKTLSCVKKIRAKTGVDTAAHLTCVGASRGQIADIARNYWDNGVSKIVALRGDSEHGMEHEYQARSDGYQYASELVYALKKIANFKIIVAAYPEVHPQAPSAQKDLDHLKQKIDAGAEEAITQFFFDPYVFLRFRDRCHQAGIKVPIIPGILPITNITKVVEMSQKCGTNIPQWIQQIFSGLEQAPETEEKISVAIAAECCSILRDNGVRNFHFYTLNKAPLCMAVCRLIGVRGKAGKVIF